MLSDDRKQRNWAVANCLVHRKQGLSPKRLGENFGAAARLSLLWRERVRPWGS